MTPLYSRAILPWHAGRLPWPALAAKMPMLPQELEYRVIGTPLVLVDVGTHVVVDVLRDALSVDTGAMTVKPCDVHPALPACWNNRD